MGLLRGRRTRAASSSDQDPVALAVYSEAFAEYRFQVQLNWSRAQFFVTSNAALLAVGAGLVSLEGRAVSVLTAAIFAFGVFSAAASRSATRIQHRYYRRARDRLLAVERAIAGRFPRVDTTPGMSGAGGVRVTTLVRALLGAIAVADAAGVVLCVVRVL